MFKWNILKGQNSRVHSEVLHAWAAKFTGSKIHKLIDKTHGQHSLMFESTSLGV